MSFRTRLTSFFVLIVIVPMVAVTAILFRLISDNETGKADARVGEAQAAAIGLYDEARDRARVAIARVGRDGPLFSALRAGNETAAQARAKGILTPDQIERIVVTLDGRRRVDVGDREALARASTNVLGTGKRAVGRLAVAAQTAEDYAELVHRVTDLEAVVRRGERTLASTLAAASDARLPRGGQVADLDLGGTTYRAASFDVPGERLRISVLADKGQTSSDIGSSRLLALALLGGFFVLAITFAVAVSRSLAAQIGRFLEAAQRLAGGDFSTEVPTEGRDEFAALGGEFNKMSRQLEARLEELRQERRRLEDSLLRIGEAFASNLDRDALLEIVTRTAVDGVSASAGRATAREAAGEALSERAVVGEVADAAAAIHEAERRVLQTDLAAEATADGVSALAYPLRGSDGSHQVAGMISVARAERPFSARERELFHYLAGQAAVSIENVDLHRAAQRQAVTDELTGLFNHRRFQEVMAREVERSKRFDQDLGLVMLDIDNFKSVNDTYGHPQGDLVLRKVAAILRETSREIDEPARYGGEEMAVALPQTDIEGAYRLAERVRERIAGLDVPLLDGSGTLHVTASFGVAAMPHSAGDKEELVAAADAALYAAKRSGKNKTVRAG